MEWGVLIVVVLGLLLGFLVLQASLAARHWRRVIGEGDVDALREALDEALDAWRGAKAPKDTPIADWQGLQSAVLIAADRDRCRISVFAGADVRVVDNRHEQVGTPMDVARRVAVLMAERLLYDIPHVRFDEVQIDVHAPPRDRDGSQEAECLLSTRVPRAEAAVTDWDGSPAPAILDHWNTRESTPDAPVDPGDGALISAERPGSVFAPDLAPDGTER